MLRRLVLILLVSASAIVAVPAHADIELTTELVVSGLARPVFLTAPPGDFERLFIVEQQDGNEGRVRIVKNGTLLPTPFLTVSPVSTSNEQGLLGLAFAPDYAVSGTFYLYYTDAGGTSRLERADGRNQGYPIRTVGLPYMVEHPVSLAAAEIEVNVG